MKRITLDTEIFFNKLRNTEYSRLDKEGHVYLDYTGGNLPPQSLLAKHFQFLSSAVYGNPHSTNVASQLSSDCLNASRQRVLEYFNAENYQCIFTANASAGLQIVGECYHFTRDSILLLTADNHNSVNGIREYCTSKGGSFSYCSMNHDDLSIDEKSLQEQFCFHANKNSKLFAYPAQSNASGVKHSLSWISMAQAKGWDVLLDAAAFVSTSKLDLAEISPEFVCVSFYKMFGYPTGVGCLLVRNSAFQKLRKPWFAGGTVSLVSVSNQNHFLLEGIERFENGTVNYLNIPAICAGLQFLERIGMQNISERIRELTYRLIQDLTDLKHDNGLPLIKIYGSKAADKRGGTVMMNFFDNEGFQYPFQIIEKTANDQLISIRTGCFCNPGIDEVNSNITCEEMTKYFQNRKGATYDDMTLFLGKLRGAVRVSVGIPTVQADLDRFIRLARSFINQPLPASGAKNEGLCMPPT